MNIRALKKVKTLSSHRAASKAGRRAAEGEIRKGLSGDDSKGGHTELSLEERRAERAYQNRRFEDRFLARSIRT